MTKEYKVTYTSGLKYDDLIGGESVKVYRANVRLADGIEIKRGMLIARGSDGYYRVAEEEDTNKMLAISAMDSGENRIITAYYTGLFNRSKIITKEGVNIGKIELQLREQGIYLTDINEIDEAGHETEEDEGSNDE